MSNQGKSPTINHKGIVQKIDSNSVFVAISPSTACSGCHAEGSCSLAGKEEKIIEVSGIYKLSPGDTVEVQMEQSMGFAALFLGYVFPFLVVLISLIILISLSVPELISGLVSIAMLLPYYLVLMSFRKRINEKFTFKIKS
jgi:sigma-E factor negative regulatory protein RseC